MINVCVFEDQAYTKLLPLTFCRPAYDLLIGINTLFDKIYNYFNYTNITLHSRPALKGLMKLKYPKLTVNQLNKSASCLFINGRVLMSDELMKEFSKLNQEKNYLFTYKEEVVAVQVNGKALEDLVAMFSEPPNPVEIIKYIRPISIAKELKTIKMVRNLWDILSFNLDTIVTDFFRSNTRGIIKGEVSPFSVIYNENNVFIDKGCFIEDFVVINAKNGPIYIEENAYIESGSRLEGPLFIGKNTEILGGKVKSSSIGQNCKVAGEVTNSIFYQYSNKAHAGFLGHSYIGEWVNLGAQTTSSNLKNTYSPVKLELGKNKTDTGQLFLGSILGDHVKTGINTILNTGTVVGFGSNIFGTEMHPKYIPPFSWGPANNYQVYNLDKFLVTAEKMMVRRKIEMTKTNAETLTHLYKIATS